MEFEYKEGISYPISEEKNIYKWLETHKEYAVHIVVGDHITIRKNEDLSYLANEYKEYLTSTDYVVTKISEAIALGDNDLVEELKIHYTEVLAKRAEARLKIREYENN